MKIAFLFLFIGLGCLILLSYALGLKFHNNGVDIRFHDSYYILSYSFIIIFSLLFLATLFAMGGVIYYGLMNRKFVIVLSFLVFADSVFALSSMETLKQLDNKVKELEKKGWKIDK